MTSHRFQCKSCGAVYTTPQSDGLEYFHVCGPLPADKKNHSRPRPDGRNENVPPGDRIAGAIIAEGKGLKCLTDKRLHEPRWITLEKARLAREAPEDDEPSPDDV